jgi:hypothetical protein
MERNDLIPQPPFAGADPVAIVYDRKLRRLSADADTYVSAIGEPAIVACAPGCRVLGDAVVLRIRRAFRSQQHERWRACLWLIRRRECNLSDFGAKPTLHWAITDSGGIHGAKHCSPKRVADLNGNPPLGATQGNRTADTTRGSVPLWMTALLRTHVMVP